MKIAAVSYLNTVPFIYGIKNILKESLSELILAPPSQCPAYIETGAADIALVTVAELVGLGDRVRVVSDYCLGSNGNVRSVVLLTNSPFDSIETLFLDPDSCTSNALVQILCKELWGTKPKFVMRGEHANLDLDASNVGYVLIGDSVFDYEDKFLHCYDLSKCWFELMKLPFVFAVWVATKNVSPREADEFNVALKYGVSHISDAIDDLNYSDKERGIDYLTNNLDFNLDGDKRKAMDIFSRKLTQL